MSEASDRQTDDAISGMSHAGVSDAQIAKKLEMSGPELKEAWRALVERAHASSKAEAVEVVIARMIVDAKKALDHQRAELALILANNKEEAVLTLDLMGRITGVSRDSTRLLGKKATDLIGMPVDVFLLERMKGTMTTSLEMQRAEEGEKVRSSRMHQRDDGTIFEAEHTLVAIYGAMGQVSGFARDICDLTQRKVHELRIEELDASVALLVAE